MNSLITNKIADSDYYQYLLDSVGVLYGEHRDYLLLMQTLFSMTYEYGLFSDKNRAMAGELLRVHYAQDNGVYLEDVFDAKCTVLEMLIALATRLMYDVGDTVEKWFWEMMTNIGLDIYDDANFDPDKVKEVINVWMSRTYEPTGKGSIFPMGDNFTDDTRTMSVWDQMNLYLTRNYPVGNWLG